MAPHGAAGDVIPLRELSQASDKALHLPVSSTSKVSASNDRVQAGLRFLGDIIALRPMGPPSKYSLLVRPIPENPFEVRGALATSRIAVYGKPDRIR